MSDTLDVGAVKKLKVNGRDPFADETISESSGGTIIAIAAATDGSGTTDVTGVSAGTATITVQPGTEDTGFSAGTDDVTVSAPPPPPTPLAVTLA